MYDLEVVLYNFLNNIYDCNNGELETDFDFIKNKVGMYFLIDVGGHAEYKETYSIDIHFYSLKENKIELLKVLENIKKTIGNKIIGSFYFTHKNVYLLHPQDTEDKEHYILTYTANKY